MCNYNVGYDGDIIHRIVVIKKGCPKLSSLLYW